MSEINEPEFKKGRMDDEKMKEMIKEVLLNNKDYYKPLFKEIIFEIITEGTEKGREYIKSHNIDFNNFNICSMKSINDDNNNNGGGFNMF